MTSTLTAYAKAAQHLPMAWLTQTESPAKDLVIDSFKEALEELPTATSYEDSLVRSALEAIIAGPDPRSGSFRRQSIQAAAKLHDRVPQLALAPKVKAPKVRKGSVIHGYAGGLFGRDSYDHRQVLDKGKDWINYVYIDGPWAGTRGTYNGDLKELIEYLVPDHHCSENCQLGED